MKERGNIISNIKADYLKLLKSINVEQINLSCVKPIIDEIDIFWEKNKRELMLLTQYLSSSDYDTCFFSGAAGIDPQDSEHVPFVLATKYKIYDDKLQGYFKALKLDKLPGFAIDEIRFLVKNNIELLESGLDIIILPLTSYYIDLEENNQFADKIFLAFFDYKYESIQDYFDHVISEEDVVRCSRCCYQKLQ